MQKWITGLALATGVLMGAAPAAAQSVPFAPDEPLSRVPGQPHSWVGATHLNAAGNSEVWIWAFTPGVSPDGFAFLTEFDCDARTARRLRREKYDGPVRVEVIVENDTFHEWDPFYIEHRLTGLICDHQPLGETVPDRAAALLRPWQD